MPRRNLPLILAAALVVLASLAGCRPGAPDRPLQDTDPVFVIPAVKEVAQEDDERDVPRLIELLSSEDAAVRAFTNESLRRVTGQDFGFQFWADEPQRDAAVARWKRYAAARRLIPADQAPPVSATTAPSRPGTRLR